MRGKKLSSLYLVLSYLVDWIIIVALAATGAVLYTIRGNYHAFALIDQDTSYPLYTDTVSIAVVAIVALVVPAVLIALFSLLIRPRASLLYPRGRNNTWKSRLWELHTAWLGLGLALTGAFFITSALKDVIGKPRPNFLARCNPDLSQIGTFTVGGLGRIVEEAPILVSVGICQNTDQSVLQDGFSSFPSGHSSFSFAGLLYLTLWLCSKLAVAIPSASAQKARNHTRLTSSREMNDSLPLVQDDDARPLTIAAPFLFLLVVAFIPVGGAIYIAASRWADNQHHGWDILAGSIIGVSFAWLGFRWYHPPIQSLLGASWHPRPSDDAFYLRRNWNETEADRNDDVELGTVGERT